jgi:hypothetical protein
MVIDTPRRPVPPVPVSERDLDRLELIAALDPRVLERVRRLELAIHLLRDGMAPGEVRRALRLRFGVAQPLAWRIVDMAVDLAGEQKP